MEWLSFIWGAIAGWIIGKFWTPISRTLIYLTNELRSATSQNVELNKGDKI